MRFRVTRFGWLPEVPDHRDQLHTAPVEVVGVLPARADLCGQCPPVCDPEQLGSCTASASAGVIGFDRLEQRFIVRNSWGSRWGMKGYSTLPYASVTDAGLASDFGTVRIVQ